MDHVISRAAPFSVRYLRQENKGPAAARNLGIREARSNLVLFTDSDIIPEARLVAEHVEWHQRNPQNTAAILGYVTWAPEVGATPFMQWYGEGGGKLFAFGRLRGGEKVTFHFFYTCNLSLKTEFLRSCGQFDEDFKSAAYEDVELGYRLSKQGLHIIYNPSAIGYHLQFFSFSEACRKERSKESASRLFSQKYSDKKISEESAHKTFGEEHPLAKNAAKKFAAALTRTLSPARPLLDSKMPLPALVYELFYWYEVNYLRLGRREPDGD